MHSVDQKALDWTDLVERCCDEELAREIVKAFFADKPAHLDTLSEAVDHNDFDRVMGEAHSLKGAAAAISAKPLALAAQQLELAAADKDAEAMKMRFQDARNEFTRLQTLVYGA